MSPRSMRLVELFAGADGLPRGFTHLGGFKSVGAVEFNLQTDGRDNTLTGGPAER